jgi:hypothetical protein
MRLPPTFGIEDDKWIPTPGDWFLGTWYFTHSNQPTYQTWKNMQWTLSATANNSFDGTLNDLTSFQLLSGPDTTTVWKIYGVSTRTVLAGNITRDSYYYVPAGPLDFVSLTWEVIAWGYDKGGVPYAVVYETEADGQIPPAFDIISRNDNGPSRDTLDAINEAVKGIKNAQLSAMLAAVKNLEQNGGRNGGLCSLLIMACNSLTWFRILSDVQCGLHDQ